MPHRPPTAADIGKSVEVLDSEEWTFEILSAIVFVTPMVIQNSPANLPSE